MNPFWKKTIRHMVIVGISLGVVGHLLGRAFLIVHQMYAGGAYNPENERVLWQTPLVMAVIGVLMTGGMDFVFGRRQKPAMVKVPSNPPSGHGS